MRVDDLRILLITVIVLCIASISNAIDVIYVDVNGPNDPGSGTFVDPFRRIQDAIDVANAGDIVEIRVGIYTAEPNNYNLDPNGKSITIRSIDPNDPEIVASTIIDPNGAGRGFYIHSGEDVNCVISGLIIRNGLAEDDSGGAILCYESNPTISNCIIKNNVADWYGGAIFCYSSSPKIIGCAISNNSAIDGGALECWSVTTVIQNCVISNNDANDASGNGGGIDCYWEGQAELNNCTVVENSASSGGGLHCVDNGKATIRNSIFWSNDAAEGAQIALEHSPFSTSEVTINYSDVQGDISAVHVDPCSILNWGSGNIDIDPCFTSFDTNSDPNLWDFHLQSAYGRWDPNSRSWVTDSNMSLCIDAGDPNSDWSGEPWPNGKRINIGAYGGTNQASKNGNLADFDINGYINFVDFAGFADKWFAQGSCIEDLTNNGVVDLADLRTFAENWLWQLE